VLTTNQKGLIAETAIIHECVKLGIGVARPYDDEPYDLIFDLRPRLLRVQCKWAVRIDEVVAVPTRRCRRNRDGLLHRSYAVDEIDAIAAHCSETATTYLLPKELSVDRSMVYLRVGPTRNNQKNGMNLARDYEFRATLTRLLGP
jgi:hypothetical protein